LTVKLYKKDELFSARDEKLFESMKLSNHCLYHLLPQQRNVGHNLRNRGHSFELIVHNYKSTRSCFVVSYLVRLFVNICVCRMLIKPFTYLLTYSIYLCDADIHFYCWIDNIMLSVTISVTFVTKSGD
jgi:hypothetical protein